MLFVGWQQFGCHVDTFEYCRYLSDRFDITYLCVDAGLPSKNLDGIDVRFCRPPIAGRIEPRLAIDAICLLRERRFDVVFLQRMKFAFLIRLLCPSVAMIFDVRSGSIEEGSAARAIGNFWIRFNAHFFRWVTAISEGLARQLRLPSRTRIVPLGASPTSHRARPVRDAIHLVYIGTFTGRCLERTIDGLGRFIGRNSTPPVIVYSLIGFGSADDRRRIDDAIRRNGLESVVEVLPRVDHDRVPEVLAGYNVGVAFTPREPWYEHQPSTKIFEYLQDGLLCIATDSDANRRVVNDRNGVLIGDTAEAFARGLERIVEMLPDWQPEKVVETVQTCSWEHVVTDALMPILDDAVIKSAS